MEPGGQKNSPMETAWAFSIAIYVVQEAVDIVVKAFWLYMVVAAYSHGKGNLNYFYMVQMCLPLQMAFPW